MGDKKALQRLHRRIISCRTCPRLIAHCQDIAVQRRRAYADETYWGRPLPGFGDPQARIVICGLAPAAHGANRTGRVFTGDRSGDWLYRALYKAGLANQPQATSSNDGLVLHNAWVTVAVRCAPPDNKPTPNERDACQPFLVEELGLLPARVIVCLGAFALDSVLAALATIGHRRTPKPKFAHGLEVEVGAYTLLASYHVSQQNTFTGRLTEPMLDAVFARANALLR